MTPRSSRIITLSGGTLFIARDDDFFAGFLVFDAAHDKRRRTHAQYKSPHLVQS